MIEAQNTITQLIQSGKDDSACRDLATSTIKDILESVKDDQTTYDNMNKGTSCKDEGQAAVTAAKNAKTSADKKFSEAKKARETACAAKVTFSPAPFNSLKENECSNFFTDAPYVAAKKKCDESKKSEATADGEAKAAAKALQSAEESAKEERAKCECAAEAAHKKMEDAINKGANSPENQKAWTKAHHMLCVLDGKAHSQCKFPACPQVTTKPLALPKNECHKYAKPDTLLYSSGSKPMMFTGSNSQSPIATKSTCQLTSQFTISAWVKPSSRTNDWARVLGKGDSHNRNYGLWISNTGYPLAQTYGPQGCKNAWKNGQHQVPLNKWTHLAMTYKQNGHNILYVNGKAVESSKCTGGKPRTDNQPLTIGKAGFHTGFKGEIKDADVYKVALDAKEIEAKVGR
jgi:hypothetical protein